MHTIAIAHIAVSSRDFSAPPPAMMNFKIGTSGGVLSVLAFAICIYLYAYIYRRFVLVVQLIEFA